MSFSTFGRGLGYVIDCYAGNVVPMFGGCLPEGVCSAGCKRNDRVRMFYRQ